MSPASLPTSPARWLVALFGAAAFAGLGWAEQLGEPRHQTHRLPRQDSARRHTVACARSDREATDGHAIDHSGPCFALPPRVADLPRRSRAFGALRPAPRADAPSPPVNASANATPAFADLAGRTTTVARHSRGPPRPVERLPAA